MSLFDKNSGLEKGGALFIENSNIILMHSSNFFNTNQEFTDISQIQGTLIIIARLFN
jgi:hypothetical protein